MLSLWTIATALVTVFKIVANGSKQTLQPLYGALSGILVSDRAQALNFWAIDRRQICWAHLLRKYVSFAERDSPTSALGRALLDYTGIIFDYWHDYRDGKLSRERFRGVDDTGTPANGGCARARRPGRARARLGFVR
jgi:transposase